MAAPRIDPQRARRELGSGGLLVCAYDDPAKCSKYHLEGSISLDELRAREGSLDTNQPLIFYCA